MQKCMVLSCSLNDACSDDGLHTDRQLLLVLLHDGMCVFSMYIYIYIYIYVSVCVCMDLSGITELCQLQIKKM